MESFSLRTLTYGLFDDDDDGDPGMKILALGYVWCVFNKTTEMMNSKIENKTN